MIKQFLYWPKLSQLILCYWTYTSAPQLIGELFNLGASFSCWFRCICVPLCVLWSLFSFYQECWRTRSLCESRVFITIEIDGVGDKLSGDTTRVDVERFLRLFWGLPDLRLFSQLPKYQLPGQGICIVLYCTTLSLSIWCTDGTSLTLWPWNWTFK